MAIDYRIATGKQIPKEVLGLTRKKNSVMKTLLKSHRDDLIACLAYRGKKLIGWACVIRLKNTFKITSELHTFVSPGNTQSGVAKNLIDRLLYLVSKLIPNTTIRYGAPGKEYYFNKTYKFYILGHGLKPQIWLDKS